MRNKKHYLILAVAVILCTRTSGQVELSAAESGLPLLERPNLTLAGIKELHVIIVSGETEPNRDGLVWKELDAKVKHKLKTKSINSLARPNATRKRRQA